MVISIKSKHSVEEKLNIVMESFSDNVSQAEICRRHGIYSVQLSKWREQFIQGGKTALANSRNTDTGDTEIDDLKTIIGGQSLAIDAFKKKTPEEVKMMIIEDLKPQMSMRNISRIS